MAELSNDVKNGLTAVSSAVDAVRQSAAFRAVLRHTARLAIVINFGGQDRDVDGVAGFALEALPKLALFRSASDSRITLLHVLVVQVFDADKELPAKLLAELSCIGPAVKRP